VNPAVVLDASAVVDFITDAPNAAWIRARLEGCEHHAPAHLESEVLSALGRFHRARQLTDQQVTDRLRVLSSIPLQRHDLTTLLEGAWSRRHRLRLVDALYVELAYRLDTVVITTDQRLARATPLAEAPGN